MIVKICYHQLIVIKTDIKLALLLNLLIIYIYIKVLHIIRVFIIHLDIWIKLPLTICILLNCLKMGKKYIILIIGMPQEKDA